jgi:Tol biopolymer transport system component
MWDPEGTNPQRIYSSDLTLMGLDWSNDGRWLAFGAGAFFLERDSEPAQIVIMRPDGSGRRVLTSGPDNAGFPSWSPDGTEIVFRYWTSGGAGGLRIVNVNSGETRVLTTEYDTLPSWSPRGDQIVFTRYAGDDRFRYDEFDIYSIRPDGTRLVRLTESEGNDAHTSWSPDGEEILWSSSRFGFKDERPLVYNQPQPYAELFIMNADGSNQRPITDNHYEEGTPAWLP